MTTLSLERLHLRPVGSPAARRLRNGMAPWSALVARSVQASRDYDAAATASVRHKVLAQFVDTGA
ncbi:MAG: hypothetical protein M3P89_06465 [Actinomycetota bacterium]|nr:hypothetical protein [Actinomycetota bacterium]